MTEAIQVTHWERTKTRIIRFQFKCTVKIKRSDIALKILKVKVSEDIERGASLWPDCSRGPPTNAQKLNIETIPEFPASAKIERHRVDSV
jgi:hypothetical protein